MYQLIRAIFMLIGFSLATSLLKGVGLGFPGAYAAPRELSALVVTTVFILCTVWSVNSIVRFLFAERFKK